MIKDMVNTTFDELAPQLNGGLNKLYKDKLAEVLEKTGDLALAKKKPRQAQVAMVDSCDEPSKSNALCY